jgi:plastocyanin
MRPRCAILLLAVTVVSTASLAAAAELVVHVQTRANAPLEDAIVYAVPAIPAQPATGQKYNIDQVNRQFVPRINVVQTGTSVRFPNSDNIRHSVYSFSAAKVFTLKLYAGKSADAVVFDKAGLVVLGCNIHDLMVSWLLVVDTPYFARTDHGGAATLARLPPGDYTLRTWHEPMTEEQQVAESVHVDATGEPAARTVHLDVAPTPAAAPPGAP